jgi:hypothetical protein
MKKVDQLHNNSMQTWSVTPLSPSPAMPMKHSGKCKKRSIKITIINWKKFNEHGHKKTRAELKKQLKPSPVNPLCKTQPIPPTSLLLIPYKQTLKRSK